MVVGQFKTKSGTSILVRYPTPDDVNELLRYINELSQEDTYITFSGEKITQEQEETYLYKALKDIHEGDAVHLLAFDNTRLIGVADIQRDKTKQKRALHVAVVGLSIAKEYRSEGIGRQLMIQVMEEAKKRLAGLRCFTLQVYAPNTRAIKLYESLGFKNVGMIPGGGRYKGEYIDQIIMWQKL